MMPRHATTRRYRTYPVSQPGSGLKPVLAYPEILCASLQLFNGFCSILVTRLEIQLYQAACKTVVTGLAQHNAQHISLLA